MGFHKIILRYGSDGRLSWCESAQLVPRCHGRRVDHSLHFPPPQKRSGLDKKLIFVAIPEANSHCMHKGVALIGLVLTPSAFAGGRAVKGTAGRNHLQGVVRQLRARTYVISASGAANLKRGMSAKHISIQWFRKGLRLHDNRSLLEACEDASAVYPVFVVDSDPASPESRAGSLRTAFLLESLKDLDDQLRARRSRLFVVRGKPEEELPKLFREWGVTKLAFEADFEPRSLQRDREVRKLAEDAGVQVEVAGSSTLRNLDKYVKKEGTYIKSYGTFLKLHENAGPVPPCAPDIDGDLPPPGSSSDDLDSGRFSIPTFDDLGVEPPSKELKFRGGEREALARFDRVMAREVWISKFEKPKTSPNSIEPSTTVLSMYLSHGCLSHRKFWHGLCRVYDKRGGSRPPVSLKGQLLWREFNYFSGYTIPNFDKMVGNPVVRQIPWDKNEEKLAAWREARTGFPFIDAVMTQLKDEGWMHHLARHAVACFLTRGDLWQSWEDGAGVFDELLLDADWSINNFNWQWLSCSAFFYQYFRCYSPVAFGKKTDKNGDFIRKYVPILRKFPSQYIYEPWKAPLQVQRGCKCIIGKDYPKPIVDHCVVSGSNKGKMHAAYDASNEASSAARESNSDGPRGGARGLQGAGAAKSSAKGAGSGDTRNSNKRAKW